MSTHYLPRVQVPFADLVKMNDEVNPEEGNLRIVFSEEKPKHGEWPKIRDATLKDWSPKLAGSERFALLEFDAPDGDVLYSGYYEDSEILNLVWLTFNEDGKLTDAWTYGPNQVEEYLADVLGDLVSEHDDEYNELSDQIWGGEDDDEPSESGELDAIIARCQSRDLARAAVISRLTDDECENMPNEEFNELVRQELERSQQESRPSLTRTLIEAIKWPEHEISYEDPEDQPDEVERAEEYVRGPLLAAVYKLFDGDMGREHHGAWCYEYRGRWIYATPMWERDDCDELPIEIHTEDGEYFSYDKPLDLVADPRKDAATIKALIDQAVDEHEAQQNQAAH